MYEISSLYPQLGFVLIALLLGMRHGLDLDHLAVIDSMTRRLPLDSKLSSYVGFLFSLGHGMAVIFFCLLINVFIKGFQLPLWLHLFMTALSILFLIIFGLVNIYSLLKRKNKKLSLFFLPIKILQQLNKLKTDKPFKIMLVGSVFAISFDTVSQAAILSLNATNFLSLLFSLVLGLVFMFGMMLSDGVNGYIIAFLIRKATKFSLNLAKTFTLLIGLFSTGIGFYEITQLSW